MLDKREMISSYHHRTRNLLVVVGCIQPLAKLVRISLAVVERLSGLYFNITKDELVKSV